MASGDYVSGYYSTTLSGSGARLVLGNAPAHRHNVKVVGPDGGGVSGAVVNLPASCTTSIWNANANWIDGNSVEKEVWVEGYEDEYGDWVEGYYDTTEEWVDGHYEGGYEEGTGETALKTSVENKWASPYEFNLSSEATYNDGSDRDVYSAVTDEDGIASFWGYGDPIQCTRVGVEYNDGIVIQSAAGELGDNVTLPYVPIVTITTGDVAAHAGAAVNIPINISLGGNSGLKRKSQGLGARARGVSTAVSITPPPGAGQGRSGARLRATTNSAGSATLKVCATASGVYQIRAKGSMRRAGVMIRVLGAPPTAVTSLSARSASLGNISAAWNPPAYDGGAKVKEYVIEISKDGRVIKQLKTRPGTRRFQLSGFVHTASYRVIVRAVTRYGSSVVASKNVTVA
jgi:hypothetical protein